MFNASSFALHLSSAYSSIASMYLSLHGNSCITSTFTLYLFIYKPPVILPKQANNKITNRSIIIIITVSLISFFNYLSFLSIYAHFLYHVFMRIFGKTNTKLQLLTLISSGINIENADLLRFRVSGTKWSNRGSAAGPRAFYINVEKIQVNKCTWYMNQQKNYRITLSHTKCKLN